jgi:hypothetical protein
VPALGAVLAWTRFVQSDDLSGLNIPWPDYVTGLSVDAAGNIYVSGTTWGDLNGVSNASGPYNDTGILKPGEIPLAAPRQDAFLVQYSPLGVLQRTVLLGTYGCREEGLAVGTAADGSVYLAGLASRDLDGQISVNPYSNDAFLTRFNASGAKQWTRLQGVVDSSIFGMVDTRANKVAATPAGGVITAGDTLGSLSGQPYSGRGDVFLSSWNSNGTLAWTRILGTDGEESLSAMAVAGDGSVVIGGTFIQRSASGTLNGQQGPGFGDVLIDQDVFIAKYTSSGALAWSRVFGTIQNEWINGVVTAADGSIYVVGSTELNLDGQINSGSTDVFISRYDAAGARLWTRLLGTDKTEWATGIAIDASGSVYIAGTTLGHLDGQIHSGRTGSAGILLFDHFISRINADGSVAGTSLYAGVGDTDDQLTSFAVGADGSLVLGGTAVNSALNDTYGFVRRLVMPGAAPGVLSIAALAADQAEGNAGPTAFTFRVTRSGNTNTAGTVNWAVSSSSAGAADFSGGSLPSGTLAFAVGQTTATITCSVQGDSAAESDEGFTVTLSNPSAGLSIATASASGTIRNDDAAAPPPSQVLSAANGFISGVLTGSEPDNPSRPGSYCKDYQLQLSQATSTVVIGLLSNDFDAFLQVIDAADLRVVASNDDRSSTITDSLLSFTPQSGRNYLVRVSTYAPAATGGFELYATRPPQVSGNLPSVAGSVVSALDSGGIDPFNPDRWGAFCEDYDLTALVAGVAVTVGVEAGFDAYLQILDSVTGGVVAVNDNRDAATTDPQLTFTPEIGRSYRARVSSYYAEATGSFRLFSSGVAPASLSISASAADRLEGNSGSTIFSFTVSRTGNTDTAGSVNWAVSTGSVSPVDFTGSVLPSGVVAFAAGQTTATVTCSVQGDLTVEVDENFTVTLTNPSNGFIISNGVASATIRNDDLPAPPLSGQLIASNGSQSGVLTAADAQNPTRAGSFCKDFEFQVAGSGSVVVLGLFSEDFDPYLQVVDAADQSIAAFNDNQSASGTASRLRFSPQPGRSYRVRVSSASPAGSGAFRLFAANPPEVRGTLPAVAGSINSALEGGVVNADSFNPDRWGAYCRDYALTGFQIGRQVSVGMDASFDAYLQILDAVSGELVASNDNRDGSTTNALISFTPEAGRSYLARATSFFPETTGPFRLFTSAASQGVFSITALEADRPEGNGSVTVFTFVVSRSGDVTQPASIDWVVESTAATASDFAGDSAAPLASLPGGRLSFVAGQISQTISLKVLADEQLEQDEAFSVVILNPSSGAIVDVPKASALIRNDDASTGGGPEESPYIELEAVGGSFIQLTDADERILFSFESFFSLLPDVITGYDPAHDRFRVDSAAFGEFASASIYVVPSVPGFLALAGLQPTLRNLKLAGKAQKKLLKRLGRSGDLFAYNQSTGQLFYDDNGKGAGFGPLGGVIAVFDDKPLLPDSAFEWMIGDRVIPFV